jgi:hypothetical protein
MTFTEIITVYTENMKRTHAHTHTLSEMHMFLTLQLVAHVETTGT